MITHNEIFLFNNWELKYHFYKRHFKFQRGINVIRREYIKRLASS